MNDQFLSIVTLLVISFTCSEDELSPKETIQLPELRLELLRRVESDQKARMQLINWVKEAGNRPMDNNQSDKQKEFDRLNLIVKNEDKNNTARMAEIISKHGWPTHALVGKDGAHAAWLLIQHADEKAQLQRICLDLMTKLPADQVSQVDVAYLTDRVLLAEGKKQIYGTQYHQVEGKWQPRNLEDPNHVDQRRKKAGLEPLAEYARQLEELYGKAEKN